MICHSHEFVEQEHFLKYFSAHVHVLVTDKLLRSIVIPECILLNTLTLLLLRIQVTRCYPFNIYHFSHWRGFHRCGT